MEMRNVLIWKKEQIFAKNGMDFINTPPTLFLWQENNEIFRGKKRRKSKRKKRRKTKRRKRNRKKH